MNMNDSPIEVTVTIHFVLTVDPIEQYPLAAFAEFLPEQRLESTLLEAIIERTADDDEDDSTVSVKAWICWDFDESSLEELVQ
jgi:hypothetical protein